ncbi:MAG: hypothetical protein IPJ77_13730 [Planctomycetes bacterium]|nr:hypothetical protein [Planctomycetota bacterium]
MIDPLVHLALFLVVVLVIIVVHGFYFTTDDRKALTGVPWRFARFVFWCALIAGAMILAEHTVASVS